jgi:transcriptional regulator with XRE-family HTH domain
MAFEKDPLAAVAQVLKKMRLAREWSPEDLAQRAGVSPETILAYESAPASLSEATALQVFESFPLHPEDRTSFQDAFLITPPHDLITHLQSCLYELEAAVCIDEQNLTEALDKLDFILLLHPSPDRTARIHLSRAAVLGELGRDRRALDALIKAETYLDPAREPHLWLRMRMEQLYILCQTGRYREAEPLLKETQKLANQAGRDRERLQVRRLAGWVANGLVRTEEALRILQPVCAEMIAAGLVFEAGCVAFDLAGLLAARGDTAELAELAQQMKPLTEHKKLSHDARTTLKVFCFAVRRGTFTVEMGIQLSGEFRKAGSRLPRPYELPV